MHVDRRKPEKRSQDLTRDSPSRERDVLIYVKWFGRIK